MIISDDTKLKYILENGLNINRREIELFGEINEEMAKKIVSNITILEAISSDKITININSSGGGVDAGLVIINKILNSNCRFIMQSSTNIKSMGVFIFLAGDVRLISRFSCIMMHEMSINFHFWKKVTDITNYVNDIYRSANELIKWVASRTSVDSKFWHSVIYDKNDRYFTHKEAISLGIATGYIKKGN